MSFQTSPATYVDPIPLARPRSPKLLKSEAQKIELGEKEIARREYRLIHNEGTVVRGIADDRVFSMLRRWSVQIQHVRAPSEIVPRGELDLRTTTKRGVPFNTEIIRSNSERLAMSLGVDLLIFVKEMDRLSSWSDEDRYRTRIACGIYAVAWFFQMVTAAICLVLALLIFFPELRLVLFPHEETFDPYTSKSEQVEEATKEFFKGVADFVQRTALGQAGITSGGGSKDDEEDGGQYQDEHTGHERKQQAIQKGAPPAQAQKHDEKAAQKKREELIETYGRMLQDGLGYVADLSECMANALANPNIYPETNARRNLALVVVVLSLVLSVTPARVFSQGCSLAVGLAFFGRPVISKAWRHFVYHVPQWKQIIDPRNSFLSHVPDNQQLVLHLLRGREYAHSPLMLPPTLEEEEKAEQEYIDDVAEVRAPFNVSVLRKIEEAEKNQGPTSPDQGRLATFLHRRHRANKDVLKHRFRDIAGLQSKDEEPKLKYAIKGKVTHGIEDAFALPDDGDVDAFPAEHANVTGHLVLQAPSDASRPPSSTTLAFIPDHKNGATVSLDINDILELKKADGAGKFTKQAFELIAGHSLGMQALHIRLKSKHGGVGKLVADGVWVTNVQMEDDDEEREEDWFVFSKVGRRDQLFMRLCAMGEQIWETV